MRLYLVKTSDGREFGYSLLEIALNTDWELILNPQEHFNRVALLEIGETYRMPGTISATIKRVS